MNEIHVKASDAANSKALIRSLLDHSAHDSRTVYTWVTDNLGALSDLHTHLHRIVEATPPVTVKVEA